jgi:hypothetical protein
VHGAGSRYSVGRELSCIFVVPCRDTLDWFPLISVPFLSPVFLHSQFSYVSCSVDGEGGLSLDSSLHDNDDLLHTLP